MTKTKTNFRKCYVKPSMEVAWMDPEELMDAGGSAPNFEPEGPEPIGAKANIFSDLESDDLASSETWGCDYELEW